MFWRQKDFHGSRCDCYCNYMLDGYLIYVGSCSVPLDISDALESNDLVYEHSALGLMGEHSTCWVLCPMIKIGTCSGL